MSVTPEHMTSPGRPARTPNPELGDRSGSVCPICSVSPACGHEARLIPTSGINGVEEQERRATSALLAVLGAVREYGGALLKPLGAPAGRIECYIEVPFVLGDKKLYPDGLVRVSRGTKSWTALVEVKTGPNELATEQLENYLDIAREQGFDAVITISNEIPAVAGQHPTKVDKRKLRKVALHPMSWSQVLAEAVMQKEFRGVADPDQAWILGELIRYLEHERSGARPLNDTGPSPRPTQSSRANVAAIRGNIGGVDTRRPPEHVRMAKSGESSIV